MGPGSLLTLDIEKPVAGGRMLARSDGRVVLVWPALPGERVRARVERVTKGVVFAEVIDVLTASSDRREGPPGWRPDSRQDRGPDWRPDSRSDWRSDWQSDWRCGGNVYAHIDYPRQLQFKGEILRDAFKRIGKISVEISPEVVGSPETGYRLRARLHAHGGRLGFYRENSHEICDVAATEQCSVGTVEWIARATQHLKRGGVDAIESIEIAENIPSTERVCHVQLRVGQEPTDVLASFGDDSLTGLIATSPSDGRWTTVERREHQLAGVSTVTDTLSVSEGAPVARVVLRRDVRAFFQSNRFLVEALVRHVLRCVPGGPVVDLYAGVGLFGLSAVAAGASDVTLVEGDPVSGANLTTNSEPFEGRAQVRRVSVEAFLHGPRGPREATFIVDPPRTGLSREASADIVAHRPARLVYVSCDPATLARDARTLLDNGYALAGLTGFDLFPNTAHVEAVAVFA